MINTDYKINALDILLVESCLSKRYYPLIKCKTEIISGLLKSGCVRKNDVFELTDEELLNCGLRNDSEIRLFRRFLKIYDPDKSKFREIENLCLNPSERFSYNELYCLPGVRHIRASLYYQSGYKALADFINANVDDVIKNTSKTINGNDLSCKVPLPKEIRTHIAVSRAFLTE